MFPISLENRSLFGEVYARRFQALNDVIVLFDEYFLFAGDIAVNEAIAPQIHLPMAVKDHHAWMQQHTFPGLKFSHCEMGLNAALQFAYWLRDGDSDYEEETCLNNLADRIIEIIKKASEYPDIRRPDIDL